MLSYIPHSKPTINQSDISTVNLQLQSHLLSKGAKVSEFEELIAKSNNVNYSVCTSSGSAALQLVLASLTLPRGSEVILPSYVCKSVYNSVLAQGLVPVLCDIEQNWLMTFNSVKTKITENTTAIILVHTFGIDAWDEKFSEFKIPIIEDFCQGYALQQYTKRPLKGIAGFCSFNATKFITTGEGGAIITNDEVLHYKIKETEGNYIVNSTFSDFQASLGISQLSQLNHFVLARKEKAKNYFSGIKKATLTNKFQQIEANSICFRFLLFGDFEVDEIIQKAAEEKIAIRRGVDVMLHKYFKHDDLMNYTETEIVFNSTISLPIYPSLSGEEQERVINFVNKM